MTNVAFLAFAVVVSIVGSLIIVLRHRKPSTLTTSIDDFAQRMKALSPEQHDESDPPSGSS